MKVSFLECCLITLVGQTLTVKCLFGYWIPDTITGISIRLGLCLLITPLFYKLFNTKY